MKFSRYKIDLEYVVYEQLVAILFFLFFERISASIPTTLGSVSYLSELFISIS